MAEYIEKETTAEDNFCSYGEKRIALEDVIDIEKQTEKNNAAMRRVIDFITGGKGDATD